MPSHLRNYQMRTVLREGRSRRKYRNIFLWIFAAIILAAVLAPLLDNWTDRRAQRTAALDFQFREMTNAFIFGNALEHPRSHPMNRLYHERRDALLKAGYLKMREFQLREGFESGKAANAFVWRFASKFPGTEFRLQGAKPPANPTLVVYARDSDFLAIKWFVLQGDEKK